MSEIQERIARAMSLADHDRNPTWGGEDAWDQLEEYEREDYLAMAQAAIDTLGFTEESKYLEDGFGGVTYHRDGTSTAHSKPNTKCTRLVTPWTEKS